MLTCIVTSSCQKQVNYQPSIDSLKASISLLQKRSDSLTIALAATDLNLGNLSKKVDSISLEISVVISQINQLAIQLTASNANISSINSQIATLNQQYSVLLSELNSILAQCLANSLLNGLLAYYPFTGNSADSSGNGNNGSVFGASLTTDRNNKPNSAYSFSTNAAAVGAIGNEIYVNNNPSFNTNSLSISLWVNPNAYFWNANPNPPLSSLIDRFEGGYSNPNSQVWGINLSSNNVSAYILSAASTNAQSNTTVNSTSTIPLNSWSHIVFTYDGNLLKLYINGVLNSTVTSTVVINTNSTSGISIGESRQSNGNWFNFGGKLDDISIYNRALTQSEITYLATH